MHHCVGLLDSSTHLSKLLASFNKQYIRMSPARAVCSYSNERHEDTVRVGVHMICMYEKTDVRDLEIQV